MVHFEVVQSVEQGGAPVREAKSLTSQVLGRLGLGAIVAEEAREGERLRFRKISGTGPEVGWISGKLVAKVAEKKDVAKATPYKGKSLLTVIEAQIEQSGAEKVLTDATAKGQDPAALATAAVAQLVLGRLEEALDLGRKALDFFAGNGNKDGEGSAALALASVHFARSEPRRAIALATQALGLFKSVGDRQMEASALATAANARIAVKELPAAVEAAKDALAIFRELGDAEGAQAAQLTLNDAYAAKDGVEKARRTVADEQRAYFQGKGDKVAEARVLQAFADQQLAKSTQASDGDLKEAARMSQEAVTLYKAAGDKRLQASALRSVAAAHLFGDAASTEAVQAAEEALMVSREIGDTEGQVAALSTIANACIARGLPKEAVKSAKEALALAKQLGDGAVEARAQHVLAAARLADGDADEALSLAAEAAAAFSAAGDRRGQASALQTIVSAHLSKGDEGRSQAIRFATEALGLFRIAGDRAGEAAALQAIASAQLAGDCPDEAVAAAERARALYLLLGDRRNQAQVAHLAAQAHMMLGDMDVGVQAAMQAVVLSREVGDKWGEASALHTAVNGQLARGRHAEALRMSKDVQALFKKLGAKEMEDSICTLTSKIEEVMPKHTPGPRTAIQCIDETRGVNHSRSLFQENPNCIIWSPPCTQLTYINYCLELLKLVDDLKNISGKTSVLVTTQGVMGRQTGEPLPSQWTGVGGTTVWAVVRTVRLESPRLHITTVDVPPAATAYEIAECMRAAQIDAGTRSEVTFVVDRKHQLTRK